MWVVGPTYSFTWIPFEYITAKAFAATFERPNEEVKAALTNLDSKTYFNHVSIVFWLKF